MQLQLLLLPGRVLLYWRVSELVYSSIPRQETLAGLSTFETLATGDANVMIQLDLWHRGSESSVRWLPGKIGDALFPSMSPVSDRLFL